MKHDYFLHLTEVLKLLYSWFFPPAARALIGYFEVTWHLTTKLFPAKSLWAGNITKSMTSQGNSALTPADVDRRPPLRCLCTFFFMCYITNLLITGPSGNSSLCFPRLRLGETLRFSGNKMNCFPRDQSLSVDDRVLDLEAPIDHRKQTFRGSVSTSSEKVNLLCCEVWYILAISIPRQDIYPQEQSNTQQLVNWCPKQIVHDVNLFLWSIFHL